MKSLTELFRGKYVLSSWNLFTGVKHSLGPSGELSSSKPALSARKTLAEKKKADEAFWANFER
jgi:hypothetical protein